MTKSAVLFMGQWPTDRDTRGCWSPTLVCRVYSIRIQPFIDGFGARVEKSGGCVTISVGHRSINACKSFELINQINFTQEMDWIYFY